VTSNAIANATAQASNFIKPKKRGRHFMVFEKTQENPKELFFLTISEI
jgi:hypothetical protein